MLLLFQALVKYSNAMARWSASANVGNATFTILETSAAWLCIDWLALILRVASLSRAWRLDTPNLACKSSTIS